MFCLTEISPECRYDNECGLERICLKQKCMSMFYFNLVKPMLIMLFF